jgi:hypothetical protein
MEKSSSLQKITLNWTLGSVQQWFSSGSTKFNQVSGDTGSSANASEYPRERLE